MILPGSGLLPQGSTTRDFDVKHYLINLDILDWKGGTIKGYTDIQLVPLVDSLRSVEFDFQGLFVDSVLVDENPITNFQYDKRRIDIPFPEAKSKDEPILVSVYYHGKPQHDPVWGGFYFTGEEAYNMGIGFASDPPSVGRYWYPCVDDFTEKATHEYLIRVGKEYTAVCNGTLKDIYEFDDQTHTFHWELRDEIPCYLSSVAVAKYTCLCYTLASSRGKYPVTIYVTEPEKENAAIAFSTLPQIVAAFEKSFGPYPWERIGFVSVPFRGGAMEHATNISLSRSTITGSLRNEGLYAHEFAHSWFGDLVTCQTPADMWLNEGWATWAVAVYFEYKNGEKGYKDTMRENHLAALREGTRDESYLAVYGPPLDQTYSGTVYKKGADVANTLCSYLGNEKLFDALQKYFRDYAFKNISTEEFKSYLETSTRIPLDEFFKDWVYTPGFPHFAADSFLTTKKGSTYEVKLYLSQDLRGRTTYSNENRFDVLFMDKYWNKAVRNVTMSGENTVQTLYLPFSPSMVLVDPEETIADATIDQYRVIKNPGNYVFSNAAFSLKVNSLADSVFFRITNHWVTPHNKKPGKIYVSNTMLPDRYWTIESILGKGFIAEASFDLDRSIIYPSMKNGDPVFMKEKGKFALLYRKNTGCAWEAVPFQVMTIGNTLRFTTAKVTNGDYVVCFRKYSSP
jgi:aminopeptidase N